MSDNEDARHKSMGNRHIPFFLSGGTDLTFSPHQETKQSSSKLQSGCLSFLRMHKKYLESLREVEELQPCYFLLQSKHHK